MEGVGIRCGLGDLCVSMFDLEIEKMLFSLSNLKKRSTRDADGEQAVVPKLLHGRAALRQVGLGD